MDVTFDRPFGFIAVHRPSRLAVVAGWVNSPFAGGAGMSQDEIEARKKKAERGWLADPPPPPPSPQPHDRADKWRRMYGQMPPENPEAFR